MNDPQAKKLASMLLDYLRSTSQGALPPNLVKDLRVAAGDDDKSNNVVITSAIPLDQGDKKQLSAFVAKQVKNHPKIEYKVNPNLIAGFTLRIGDELIDTTVASKLAALKEHLGTN